MNDRHASLRNLDLGPGKEFDLVRTLLTEWGNSAQRIGDDAAVLDVPPGERLVVTTDTSVEGVHFKREWLNHFEIGYRATAAALSDLAAMGARPLGVRHGRQRDGDCDAVRGSAATSVARLT